MVWLTASVAMRGKVVPSGKVYKDKRNLFLRYIQKHDKGRLLIKQNMEDFVNTTTTGPRKLILARLTMWVVAFTNKAGQRFLLLMDINWINYRKINSIPLSSSSSSTKQNDETNKWVGTKYTKKGKNAWSSQRRLLEFFWKEVFKAPPLSTIWNNASQSSAQW